LGAYDIDKLEYPEKAVLYLYKKIGKRPFEEYYNINIENIRDLFIKLREKYNIKKDSDWIKRVSKIILYDWQKGKIKAFFL